MLTCWQRSQTKILAFASCNGFFFYKDYEGFSRIDAYLKSFLQCSSVVDGCIGVDNQHIPNV